VDVADFIASFLAPRTSDTSHPELADRHGEQPISDALNSVAVMQDDAAGKRFAGRLLQALQAARVVGLHGGGCLDLDSNQVPPALEHEINFDLILVPVMADQGRVRRQRRLFFKL